MATHREIVPAAAADEGPRGSGSGRHVVHGVERFEHDVPSSLMTDSANKLKQFWNKFKVSKSKHMTVNDTNDDSLLGESTNDEDMDGAGDSMDCCPVAPEASDEAMGDGDEGDGESDGEASVACSAASSAPVPSGSRGPDPPDSPDFTNWGIPLCVQYRNPLEETICIGDSCETCAKIRSDLTNGLARCYAPTLTPSWNGQSSSESGSDDDHDSFNDDDNDDDHGTETEQFEALMAAHSSIEHTRALKSQSMEASTMHTPDCSRPGFFGFPLVPTPPQSSVSKDAPQFNLFLTC